MQPRVLSQGRELISVEFNRTTRLPDMVNTIGTENDLVARGIRNELKGSSGRAVKVFYRDFDSYRRRHEELTPRRFWEKFPGEKHKSGTLATDQRMDKLDERVEERIRNLRNIGWFALAAFTLAILGILLPILYAEYGKSREATAQQGAEIRDLRERLQEQKNRLDATIANQPSPRPPSTQQKQR